MTSERMLELLLLNKYIDIIPESCYNKDKMLARKWELEEDFLSDYIVTTPDKPGK